jgi:chaperonin GroEL (HSP60 family)
MWDTQRDAIRSARWIGDYVGSSLGPNGLAKILLKTSDDFTITNDGALMLEAGAGLSPTEAILIEMAKSLRASSGDGSKSAVIIACELLNRAEALLDRGVHPNTIATGFNECASKAIKILQSLGQPLDVSDIESLRRVVESNLGPRFPSREDLLALSSVIVEAVRIVSRTDSSSSSRFNDKDVYVKGVVGGTLSDTRVVGGIVIDKEVEPGVPKSITGARIALLRSALEIEKTEWDVEVKLLDPKKVGTLLSDESKIILDKMARIASSTANVVLCERGIDVLLRQYLGKDLILAAKWIAREDMNRLAKATGGIIVADDNDLSYSDLGTADRVEEQDFGEKKMLVIQGCKDPETVTILVRGPSESVVREAERSIIQVLRSLRDLFNDPKVVFGGGATEVELATRLRGIAAGLGGKERAVAMIFADAIDSIPVTLVKNAGGDILDLLTSLRTRHQQGESAIGVDAESGNLVDVSSYDVIEPLLLKVRVIKSGSEAASAILSVDEVLTAEFREEKERKKKSGAEKLENRPSAQEALETNISIAKDVSELIKKSLGPNGMTKLMVDNIGDAKATSDGATIMKFLYAQHPVAKLLVDAAVSHSKNLGDGTKTLIVLVGELLFQAERLLNQGIRLPAIRRGYRASADLAIKELEKLSQRFDLDNRETLRKIVQTVMHEDLVQNRSVNGSEHISGKIAGIVLDAFAGIRERYGDQIAERFDSKKIKVIKKTGLGRFESSLVDGYIVDKEVSANEMPKHVEKARIAVLDYWLGITQQTLRRETRIQIRDPAAMRDYLDSASKIAKDIAERIILSRATVIFCSKRTDDLTKRLLANAGIMVVEAVSSDDMEALCELTGAAMISDQSLLGADLLGEADLVEESDIHGSRLVSVEGCPHKGYTTVFIRGAIASVVDETERILCKTIRTLIHLVKDPRIVPGEGSSELHVTRELKRRAIEISGREQFAMLAYSSALEGIPRTLFENAGLDPMERVKRPGVAIDSLRDTSVWDPFPQKRQVILNATNIANLILKLGHTVKQKRKLEKAESLRKT